jgi:hypothetical protein
LGNQTDDATIVAMPRFSINLAEWFTTNSEAVDRNLKRYFGGQPKKEFTGRWFDQFAAIGDPNQFNANDILAVEALSVQVRSEEAAKLLITEAERFNELLRQIPREQDIWNVSGAWCSAPAARRTTCTPP